MLQLILIGLGSLYYRFAPVSLLRALGQLSRLARHPAGHRRAEDVLDAGVDEILAGRDPGAGKRWIVQVRGAVAPEILELCARRLYARARERWADTAGSTRSAGRGGATPGDRLCATLRAGSHLAPDLSPPESLLRTAMGFPTVRADAFAREVLRRHGPPGVLAHLAGSAGPGEFRRILFALATHDVSEATKVLHEASPLQASSLTQRDLEVLAEGESAVASLDLRRALAEAREPELPGTGDETSREEDRAARGA